MKLALVALVVAGCIQTGSVQCEDGTICPAGTQCHGIANGGLVCVTDDQLAACNGKPDLAMCEASTPSSCHDGACLPIVCGNNLVDLGEACDDGNTITGDGCSGDCVSNETCGNGSVDPLKIVNGTKLVNELCDDGNHVTGDGCASTCALEALDWQQLGPAPPSAQSHPAMAFDAARRRVVMFGGLSSIAGQNVLDDSTFEWNGIGWAKQPTPIAPGGRQDGRMVFDAAHREILLYGGSVGDDDASLADMWRWDGDRWSVVQSATPPQRAHFGMVYDSGRKVVVLFGGFVDSIYSNDTWEWDGTAWHEIHPPTSPEPRGGFVMAYDPKRGVVVLASGSTDQPTFTIFNDTWEYDGATWTRVNTITPPGLLLGAMAWDATGQRLIAYGGFDGAGSLSAKTYAYNGQSWVSAGAAQPGALYKQDMASDPVSGTIVMYGGDTDAVGTASAKTWIFNGTAWSLAPAQTVPTASSMAAGFYDPLKGREWMFGGQDAALTVTAQMWSYDGSVWTKATPAGGPSARVFASSAYDAARHKAIVFGGQLVGGGIAPNETWLWDGAQWTLATPSTSPPARQGAAMAYDAKRKKVVMFGGQGAGAMPLSDTWEWDGDWHLVPIAGQPNSRIGAEASFDPVHGIVVRDGVSPPLLLPQDTIAFDGAAWTTLDAINSVPGRGFGTFTYEPLRQRSLLIEGIRIGGGGYGDTWEWDGTNMQQVLIPQHPPARGGAIAFPGPNGSDVILYGGTTAFDTSGTRLFDTWRLRFDSAATRENCDLDIDADRDGLAGCADPDCWARCTPLCAPGTTCDPSEPRCGDGTCNAALETCRSCPMDCTCTPVCGDTFCDSGETKASCPGDCP